ELEAAGLDFDKAIQINPCCSDYYFDRADIECHLQNYAAAIDNYNNAIRLNPNRYLAYVNRALAKIALGDYSSALEDFDILIDEKNIITVEVYFFHGYAKYFLKEYADAIEDLDFVIQRRPDFAFPYIKNPHSENVSEKCSSALTNSGEAGETVWYKGVAFYIRGLCKQMLNDISAACEDWRKAESLGSKEAAELLIKYCK
ncbi:MAG: tetratricopeptide repeat protein, partial [Bacteroidota bacterium]|nr:tetratricopeptide repeat protein [Bacteroidota bacterium]